MPTIMDLPWWLFWGGASFAVTLLIVFLGLGRRCHDPVPMILALVILLLFACCVGMYAGYAIAYREFVLAGVQGC